jgi:two-component system OmpR family response regulator
VRVLLAEDDERTAAFIARGLREAGFVVIHARDGDTARLHALHEPYDVVIMDLMLPKMDGLAVIAAMRQARSNTPVLVLSARDSVDDKVKGLQTGADDYLAKPFAFSELLWRVQALIRRSSTQAEPARLSVADLEMDLLARTVTRSGRRIDLQTREFELLEYLLRNAGRVVTRTMILEHVWEYNFDPQTNVVESRMSRLRAKIDVPFERPLIHTLRGAGYVLRSEP